MAVALLIAPLLLVAVIILGHQMRAGQPGADERGNILYRAVMALLLPVRYALRLVMALLWALNACSSGLLVRWRGGFYAVAAGENVQRRRADRAHVHHRAGRGAYRPDHLHRAVPLLLDRDHGVQDQSPDPAVHLGLLALTLDAGAFPVADVPELIPALAGQHRPGGDWLNC